ncbi:MAG: cytochrome c oxidase subunit II [Deltaproteobacteria bacterium]|nr:cytochrome c oxidase subunit II [Deltaproteobacteria bacterium]
MIRTPKIALIAFVISCMFIVAPVSAEDEHARGRQLYALCAQCHGQNGAGAQLFLAPAIAGLDQWYVQSQFLLFQSGVRGLNWQDVGGLRMHPMSQWVKGDADVAAVSAYVASLPRVNPPPQVVGGNAETGKALYSTCASCHGVDGKGNEAMNAPPLIHASDWYLVSSLEKYKAGIRGSNPKNTNAIIMRGMSNLLPNDQAIKDVVAYITTMNNEGN